VTESPKTKSKQDTFESPFSLTGPRPRSPLSMEKKILARYRLSLGWNRLPVELHRTPTAIMYRGQELESGREMAIELAPWTSTDPVAREDLEREAKNAKQIRHVNIPTLYDFGIEDGQLIYVTEYFDGHTATAWVAARGPLPAAAALHVAVQVADALRAASFHYLYHPALSPANIVFVPDLTPLGEWPAIKVIHWLGLPTNFATAETGDDRLAAAAHFASPEQLRGEKINFASAAYSLGCTICYLLTGVPPPLSTQPSEGARTTPPDSEKLRGVPKIVRHLLGRMLRVNPAERPQDPVALTAFLRICLARVERRDAIKRRLRLPIGVPSVAAEVSSKRQWRTKAFAAAAFLLLCAIMAAIAAPRYFHPRAAARTNPRAEQSKAALAVVPTEAAPTELPGHQIAAETTPPVESQADLMAATNASLPKSSSDEAVTGAIGPATPAAKPTPAEVAPPEQGPAQTDSPNEWAASSSLIPADFAVPKPTPIAELAANLPPPPASDDFATEVVKPKKESSKPAETISQQEESAPRSIVEKSTSRKAKAGTSTKVTRTKPHKSSVARAVSRAKKLPALRVGRQRAELVGTTSDGRWILSVSVTGRRIIVPPPPGYSP